MKISFSNVLAITSLMIWATAWAATETNASSAPAKPVVHSIAKN